MNKVLVGWRGGQLQGFVLPFVRIPPPWHSEVRIHVILEVGNNSRIVHASNLFNLMSGVLQFVYHAILKLLHTFEYLVLPAVFSQFFTDQVELILSSVHY